MKSLSLARSLLLLGAASAVGTPADTVVPAEETWPVQGDGWEKIRAGLAAFAAEGECRVWRALAELGLDVPSRWLVALVAAVEVYPEAAAAASLLAEDERLHLLTPVACARLLHAGTGIGYLEALGVALEGGAARRLGLIEAVDAFGGRPASQRALRLDARDLGRILGGETLARERAMAVQRLAPAAGFAFTADLVAGAAELLRERRVLCLRGSPRAARQLACDIAARRSQPLALVRVEDDIRPGEIARIRDALPAIDLMQAPAAVAASAIERLGEAAEEVLALVPISFGAGSAATFDAPLYGIDEATRVWELALGPSVPSADLGARLRVDLAELRSAVREADDAARVAGRGAPDHHDITRHVLAQGSRRMGRMVTPVRGEARLEDSVVPPPLKHSLEDIVAWYRASPRAWRELGLSARTRLGRGLLCLFSGKPGTGKTFAAQCLANTLGLNLYRIDLAQVVSKYIGETEKALSQVFDEAEAGHGILLFDEADALFGKRSEVRDAHDRYANIEVGYLLQRVESFDGVTILTTNLRSNLDPAFIRRFKFLLDFPMPDRDMRRRLWDQSLPAAAHRAPNLPLGEFVERFRLAGGDIFNIGVAAAHMAAATASGVLTTAQLVRATYRELEKTGRARAPADFGPLAGELPADHCASASKADLGGYG